MGSRLEALPLHLLKWEVQQDRRAKSRQRTIKDQRRRLDRRLQENSRLKSRLTESIAAVYPSAVIAAANETGLDEDHVPGSFPYTDRQLFDQGFLPDQPDMARISQEIPKRFRSIWMHSAMTGEQPNNPLHGVSLERVVLTLVDHYGWELLAEKININCFKNEPSVKSSLKFLRRTPWARAQVEDLYLSTFTKQPRSIQ